VGLIAHLKTIIVAARSRDIPDKPPLPLPKRKELPTLGTQSRDAVTADGPRARWWMVRQLRVDVVGGVLSVPEGAP